MSHRQRVRSALIASAALLAVSAVACSSTVEGDVSEGMGNATPSPAKVATADHNELKGSLIPIDENIVSAVAVDDRLVLRSEDNVLSGTVAKPVETKHKVDASCGELAPGGSVAIIPCNDGIHVLSPQGDDTAVIGRGTAYSSAVGLSDGRIIGHQADSDKIDVYGADGEHSTSFTASRDGSQLVAVPNPDGGETTRLMEVNRSETSVHEIVLDESRTGNGLRAGIGVGPAVAMKNGTIGAVDAKASQLLVYTMTDIVRLHEAAPVPAGPWGIAADDGRNLFWVTSTVDGTLTGWDVSAGTPNKVAELKTVANPQSVVVTPNGEVAVFSASGDGAQVLSTADIEAAITEYAPTAEQQRKDMEPRTPANNLPAGEVPEGRR